MLARLVATSSSSSSRALLVGAVAALGFVSLACDKPAPPAPTAPAAPPAVAPAAAPAAGGAVIDKAMLAMFTPLSAPPPEMGIDEKVAAARVELGRVLFHDPRLSKSQEISCNSCHTLSKYGVDNKPTSSGHKGQLGSRNSPTVWNAFGHFAQFWDGRAKDLEEQAKGPILNPVEMAMSGADGVLDVLTSIPGYAPMFQAAFPGEAKPISFENYAKAIGAFERKLVTPSRFDKMLAGDESALTDEEKRGFMTYVQTGCTTCHSGTYFGGAMYQKVGLVKPWPSDKDVGRFEVTKNEADRMMFKVPSLRNIEKTAPYFHDGSVAELPEAVKMMARHQLGKELDDKEVASIVTFLKTLTGELPADLIADPALPPSGPKTPKPDKT